MAKGYIVVDMPGNCRHIRGDEHGCPFGGMTCNIDPLNIRDVMQHLKDGTKPDWCPIKEIPAKAHSEVEVNEYYVVGLMDGRDDLIDEMFGGI